ncbi:hypothetical protein Lser_V15G15918 [Lactuca serriola]
MGRRKSIKLSNMAPEDLNDDDRISRLHDDLIHHIYLFMDTRFAVQTSLLSRRWRETWKSYRFLNFKIERPIDHKTGIKFPNFIHRFFSDRDHKSEITTIDFQSNSIKLSNLKETIIYAMSHRTQKVNIEFLSDKLTRRGGLDISLFRSQFLQDLHLSIDFELMISPSLTWDLPSLTSLNLEGVTFTLNPPPPPTDSKCKSIDLFSHFPNLKTLVLIGCRLSNIDTFIITSNSLHNLSLIDLNHNSEFILTAPNLSSFTYHGMACFSLSVKNLDSLQTANFHTIYYRALQKQPELVELMIKAFEQLHKAKFLAINSDVVRFLSVFPEVVERRRCPFRSLTSLTLVEHRLPPSSIVFSDVIDYFRSSSPGVKVNVEIGVAASWKIRWVDCL